MVDPESGDVVQSDQIQRAMELETGDLVILDDDELASLVPKESRDIEITRFLKSGTIGHEWYERPYYLGPDGAGNDYFALAEALRSTDREGIARWVMRKKEYAGALRVEGDYLTLNTLRHAGEVIPASALQPPGGRDLAQRELEMARQLISAMEDEVDLSQFKDEYRERVMGLIGAKEAGKVIKFPKAPRRKAEKDLADVLKKSLAAVQKEKRSA
jgi:DNA end-binding protein Ku